jgi:hypothetical protein
VLKIRRIKNIKSVKEDDHKNIRPVFLRLCFLFRSIISITRIINNIRLAENTMNIFFNNSLTSSIWLISLSLKAATKLLVGSAYFTCPSRLSLYWKNLKTLNVMVLTSSSFSSSYTPFSV